MNAEQLKKIRRDLKLNQQALADILGITRTWLSLMENDKKPILPMTELAVWCLFYERYPENTT